MSVVIPVKDDARFLRSCLAALARQTVRPFEVIVVDNGSTDDSAEVGVTFSATVLHETRPGIAAASAAGYDWATGDVIARIDADTVVPRDWVETLAHEFVRHPGVDVVTGRANFTDGPRLFRRVASRFYLGAYYALGGLALTHVPVFGSNFAMRRLAWSAVRNEVHFSDLLHDDFDLSYHLGRRHRIRYLGHLGSGISMRPLFDGRGSLRIRRGINTVAIHWPHDLPWLRLTRRLVLRARSCWGSTTPSEKIGGPPYSSWKQ